MSWRVTTSRLQWEMQPSTGPSPFASPPRLDEVRIPEGHPYREGERTCYVCGNRWLYLAGTRGASIPLDSTCRRRVQTWAKWTGVSRGLRV